jgi:hypothetical protein
MSVLIDQQKNYSADFGSIFRSSAIFYKPAGVQCTMSVSNYWQFKNQTEVGLLFSVRDRKGKLVERRVVPFGDGQVLNIPVTSVDEGSFELEAYAARNLRIPYAAVMAVYETPASATMVHSYGRNHALTELEEGTAITVGRESCWSVRCGRTILNRAAFHNGHMPTPVQTCTFMLHDQDGVDHVIPVELHALQPWETAIFDVEEICPDFRARLGGKDGWASIHFENLSSFTRMLLTWQCSETGEFQATHSNFDYASHQTNLIAASKPAYMKFPEIPGASEQKMVVYPRATPGDYAVALEGDTPTTFRDGLLKDAPTGKISTFSFTRTDGDLPSRIVTAISGRAPKARIPFECSLGVFHEKRPGKRFHWAVVSSRLNSVLPVVSYPELYPSGPEPIELHLSLHSPHKAEPSRVSLKFDTLADIPPHLDPKDIFGADFAALGDEFGFVSVFSPYVGFTFFSTVSKNETLALEHSF